VAEAASGVELSISLKPVLAKMLSVGEEELLRLRAAELVESERQARGELEEGLEAIAERERTLRAGHEETIARVRSLAPKQVAELVT
jgi:hypothetical protein